MGKIFSSPKIPAAPPIVIDKSAASDAKADDVANADETPEVTADEQRVQNILTRHRGRLGTISTSFRGVLNDGNANGPARKTLLGE